MCEKYSVILFLIILLPPVRLNLDFDEADSEAKDVPRTVGSVLFDKGDGKLCFSQTDLALLLSRREFEKILPFVGSKSVGIQNDASIAAIIEYLSGASQLIDGVVTGDTKRLVQKSFYDAVGGYLSHFLYPYTKMVFYAGNVTYQTVVSVQELLNYCETLLNTKGLGWAPPVADLSGYKLSILTLSINLETEAESTGKPPCVDLSLLDEDDDDEMLVKLPKIESDDSGTVWLPFKRKHAFSLTSQVSSFVLMRYFVKVSECYAFQGVEQTKFNLDLLNWLNENVPGYLASNEFYPALGGVLRIFETIESGAGQKVLSMKNDVFKVKHLSTNGRDDDYGSEPVLGLPFQGLISEVGDGMKYKVLRAVVFGGTLLMFLAVLGCMFKMWRQQKKIKRQNMTGREKRHRREEKIRVTTYPTSEASSSPPAKAKTAPRSNQDYLKRMGKFQDKTKTIASMVKINEKHPANRSRYQDIQLFAVDSSEGVSTSSSPTSNPPKRPDGERKPGKR
jgi:hypothetical protein